MDDRKRYDELAKRAAFTGRVQFTRFLEPSEEASASAAAHAAGVSLTLSGGYDGAERKMAAFSDGAPDEPFPIAALLLRWNPKFADAAHRDLLGAVMGLGLERDATGDICLGVQPGTAYLFCTQDVADYIIATLESAGRAHLKPSYADRIDIAPPRGTSLRVTVQTLRLDAVLAAGCKLSRAEAQRLIAAGLVKVNHVPETRSDTRLEEGDLLSARGYGRLKIEAIQGETRRGRLGVALFRYGK